MTTLVRPAEYRLRLSGSLTPRELGPRLHASEEVVRTFLRRYYPETHDKFKKWHISPELALEIEQDYKARVRDREAERKLRIERELAGIEE